MPSPDRISFVVAQDDGGGLVGFSLFLVERIGSGGEMELVFLPVQRVNLDIITDSLPFRLISNDMLVIIALPEPDPWAGVYLVNLASGNGFEILEDCS